MTLRPVLSSVNSLYNMIAGKLTKWILVVTETQINYKTVDVIKTINGMHLSPKEKFASLDIKSLYTIHCFDFHCCDDCIFWNTGFDMCNSVECLFRS